ncbi:hypothetical protein [Brucella pituitosa]|uniref:hypothetical protein n=1 Tax=Brucella pituitosa TaxID=571256 RepID=UPI0012601CD4|nr:hypothetical protein [Brucella pituitosa]
MEIALGALVDRYGPIASIEEKVSTEWNQLIWWYRKRASEMELGWMAATLRIPISLVTDRDKAATGELIKSPLPARDDTPDAQSPELRPEIPDISPQMVHEQQAGYSF